MTKYCVRSVAAERKRLQIRINRRICEIWSETDYNQEIAKFAVKAHQRIVYIKKYNCAILRPGALDEPLADEVAHHKSQVQLALLQQLAHRRCFVSS